ncbi:MAG: hypothetical protein A2161_13760 [Candidatus Schekmanbacteria bacterium RBG_13_48_7]|uniref:YopX protein domain-containing protein n=1 Tax=Candidatus Schekmanbacteria bacterium RBG_13_48_7 TaxID=1817878 RepID=A0A1F7S1M6_9BACT|nr:MAG: hypothetical protein A2161_13760 [Candidatus Schekmanbacteria bacterium RBG_13_48_7]
MHLEFRQRNKNNGQFWIWGTSLDPEEKGGWVGPKLADNYVDPDESEQFSGLHDSDNKNIFAGDICAIEGGAENPMTGYVDFFDGCFCFCFKNLGELKTPELKYYIDMEFCKIKIVSNIHENPELLKDI